MFNYGAVNNEHMFEENIYSLTTANKFMQKLCSPAHIYGHEYSMSVIDDVTELQGFLQTLVKPQGAVNALNVINPIDDTTGHDLQLKLTLKYQDQLVDILVQNVSGVIQGVADLSEKD